MSIASSVLGVVMVSSLVGVSSAQAPAELFQLPIYPGGMAPKSAVVRDFDGDGRADVAVATAWAGTWGGVLVLRGQSDGSLGDSDAYLMNATPTFIDSADLDNDGMADLVLSGQQSFGYGSVAVLLARGAGAFHQPLEFDVDGDLSALALGDVDEDGNIDVLVNDDHSGSTHRARLLLGLGDGTLATPIDLQISEQLRSPRLADVDGDGHLDLAAIALVMGPQNVEWYLQIQLGRGDGTFGVSMRTALGTQADHLAMHDFDGDGRSDALVSWPYSASQVPGLVQVFPALPGGAVALPTTLWTGFTAGTAAIADIDGDGLSDVAIAHPQALTSGGGVAWARGLGGFAFAPTEEVRTGTGVIACYCGDIEGDGDVDLVTLNEKSHDAVGIVHAIAPGDFDTGLTPIALPPGSLAIASGDLDGDGRADLAVLSGMSHVALRRNVGQGHFAAAQVLIASTRLEQVALHDFNGDGLADVVAVGPGYWAAPGQPGKLSVWRSTPQGFAARDDYDLEPGSHALARADFDGDGHDDLAVGCDANVCIFRALADGTLVPGASIVMAPAGASLGKLVAGDFDGDGNIDLVAAPAGKLVIAYGIGAGAFAAPVRIRINGYDVLVGAGDMDLDGIDDLVVNVYGQTSAGDETALLFGRTSRSFDHRQLSDPYNFADVLIGDFDGDGERDLAGVGFDALVVLTGDGRRGFESQLSYGIGGSAQAAMADFNGDGRLDLAFTFMQESVLSVLLHR